MWLSPIEVLSHQEVWAKKLNRSLLSAASLIAKHKRVTFRSSFHLRNIRKLCRYPINVNRVRTSEIRSKLQMYKDLTAIVRMRKDIKSNLFVTKRKTKARLVRFDDKDFEAESLYFDVIIDQCTMPGQVDTGAEISVVSANVLNRVMPGWRQLKYAGPVDVTSGTQHSFKVITTRFLPLRLPHKKARAFQHKVAVVEDEDLILLGFHLLKEQGLSILCNKNKNFFLQQKVETRKGQWRNITVPLTTKPGLIRCHNVQHVYLAPYEDREISFAPCNETDLVRLPDTNSSYAILDNPACQSEHHGQGAKVYVVSSFSKVGSGAATVGRVRNLSDEPLFLPPGQIQAVVEPTTKGEIAYSHELHSDGLADLVYQRFSSNPVMVKATTSGISDKETVDTLNIWSGEEGDKVRQIYSPTDVAGFAELSNDALLPSSAPTVDPLTQVNYDKVHPKYHKFAKCLIEKHKNLLARHAFDVGDVSPTLGRMHITLKEPLPTKTDRVFYTSPKDTESLKTLIASMMKYGLLVRSRAPFGCPVFCIRRKDSQSALRFLVATERLNECIADTSQILPKIANMVEAMVSEKPALISGFDLKNAFYSIRLSKRSQKLVTIVTPFGTYESKVAMMGIKSVPGLFQVKIDMALHSSVPHLRPDPLRGAHAFIDDCTSLTPTCPAHLCKQYAKEKFEFDTEADHAELTVQERGDAVLHYMLCDKILSRLEYHNFKLGPSKISLFQSQEVILGHIVDKEGVRIDPRRIEKIERFPMIKNRKDAQKFCGFISSIKGFSPPSLSVQHAILSPLTSAKNEFKITEAHERAFQEAKRIMTTEELFLNVPDGTNLKILYTDASSLLLGGVLLDVRFPSIKVVPQGASELENIGEYIPSDRYLHSILQKWNVKCLNIGNHPGNSLFESLAVLIKLLKIHNVPSTSTLLRYAMCTTLELSPLRHVHQHSVESTGKNWFKWIERMNLGGKQITEKQICYEAISLLLDREIVVIKTSCVSEPEILRYNCTSTALQKPPIILLHRIDEEWAYLPCVQTEPSQISQFTSFDSVENDVRFMLKEQIVAAVKHFLVHRNKDKFECSIVGYFSKVVSSQERHRAIWELEAQALIQGLHHFKQMLVESPMIIACIDSQTSYYLFSPGVNRSAVKTRRHNLMLRAEYPQLHLLNVPGTQNISDFLSRMVEIPEKVKGLLDLKLVDYGPVPELEGKLTPIDEVSQACEAQDERNFAKMRGKIEAKALTVRICATKAAKELNVYEKVVYIQTNALQNLSERLQKGSLVSAQQDASEVYESLLQGNSHKEWIMIDGLIRPAIKPDLIWIPPALEGVALAYYHLLAGHAGVHKLEKLITKKYFFPGISEKCVAMTRGCQTCFVTNPATLRKVREGTFYTPPHAYHTLFVDCIEGLPPNKQGYSTILVVVDYLTGAFYNYPLKKATTAAILDKLSTLLQYTGLCTKVLFCDNAAYFRSREFLNFFNLLGIVVPKTNAYHSMSKGVVECKNKTLQMLLKKMLALSDTYSWHQASFLCSVMLNEAPHAGTGLSPNSVIFGSSRVDLGPLGTEVPNLHRTVFSDYMNAELDNRRNTLRSELKTARSQIEQFRRKRQEKRNANRREPSKLQQGQVVFIENNSLPQPGGNVKLRPKYYLSPFLVAHAKDLAVTVMRLADGTLYRVPPGQIKVFVEKDPFFDFLPNEVLTILGKPITTDSLKKLTKVDPLEIIYLDPKYRAEREESRALTRSRAREELEKAEELDSEYDSDSETSDQIQKSVQFGEATVLG